MATKAKTGNIVEDKLNALWNLQVVDSQVDKLRQVRGELPLEVEDLEDEVKGLETRLAKMEEEMGQYDDAVTGRKTAIKDSKAAIKKYTEQQNGVRNNREFESLNKEIEYQNLEIQLSEKKMKEFAAQLDGKKEIHTEVKDRLTDRSKHLKAKKKELDDIVKETEKEEKSLLKKSKGSEDLIEARLLNAYKRLRGSARNGLAVVRVERDSCGGCFNKIPPQRQLDIKTYKKIIVCEHCGRILVDKDDEVAE
jgi:uncharacterized protein